VVLEVATRFVVARANLTAIRVEHQYAGVLRLRAPDADGRPTVLLVGNSLLLAAVNTAALQRSVESQLVVYPLFLEATSYFDWYYGLRRLFREGIRPVVVAVGLGAGQYRETGVRPDYFPWLLMDWRDVVQVGADVGLDRTAISSLALASVSRFWGTRGAIRGVVLRHTFSDVHGLISDLGRRSPPDLHLAGSAEIIRERVSRLQDLCAAHGARLLLVVPPAPIAQDSVEVLKRSATAVGVSTLVPLPSATVPRDWYDDHLHLNARGAAAFTTALAHTLRQTVRSPYAAGADYRTTTVR
jgi:hypothetical protein